MKKIATMGRQYGERALLEEKIASDPFNQFETWLEEAVDKNILDVTAMVVSTVDAHHYPDSRVLLLKEFSHAGFVFFTHYDSPKGKQFEHVAIAALNFHWRELARQVRIRGRVETISREDSLHYFQSRPRDSQLSALASHQSNVIANRDQLEKKIASLTVTYANQPIPCPETWGGYRVIPFEFEFFQGRDNRLNDRIRYQLVENTWVVERLSP